MSRHAACALLLLQAIPAAATTFSVTSTDDSGPGTLRQAILDANANAGADTIAFAIPGTGPFTRALLDRGVAESDLVLIERDADFAQLLHKRFPKARILEMDADAVADQTELQTGSTGAVVSGLGLSMMPPGKIAAIIDSAFRLLRPDGAFFQLTYHPRCPVPRKLLDRRGLEARRIGKTLRNLPPASIYRIARRTPELA